MVALCIRGCRSRFLPQLKAECFRSSFGGHRDRHGWQTRRVVPQKSLRPPAIFLPAFAQPGPHRPLHPELLIVQQLAEELERLVEFARPGKPMERIRRCAAPPDVLRPSPSKEISESRGLRENQPPDPAGSERGTPGPTGCRIDPSAPEPPRVLAWGILR